MTSSAASAVASEVITRAAAKGVDLGPWFSANSARFEFFSTAMQSVLRKLPLHSLADQDRAIQAHAVIKDAVAARRPEAEVAWFERNRPLLLAIAATLSRQQRVEDAAKLANATPVSSAAPQSFELRTPAERTEANVAAIELLASKEELEDGDRELLRRYTGWGGLSIRKIAQRLPEGWVPDQRALIHEYYTPERIANAIATALLPFREDLAGNGGGNILALEPSAGIGRMVHAFGPSDWPLLRWTAVELSPVSAKLLAAIRPDLRVHNVPFEQWVADHAELQGSFDLVVSNPPYGARGKFAALDRSKGYNESKAYAYQIRRSLDFLRPGGIGVFLIPSGFVSGRSGALVGLRERVLQRAHLMAAYRLPSQNERGEPLFPGALLVTDLVFLRCRGGTVKRLPPEDEPIVQGRYFELNPGHILGKELGREGDDDDSSRRPRFGYQVEGTFTELPAIVERDQCRSCDLIPATRPVSKPKAPLPEEAQHALALSLRVASYLALLSRNDSPALAQAAAAQGELLVDLRSWLEQPTEARDTALAHRKREPRLATLVNLMASPELLARIEAKPQYEEQYTGDGNDVPRVASWLWRKSRTLTTDQLARKLADLGNVIDAPELLTQLRNAGWCEDPDGPSPLLPGEQYYQGSLWPKYDRAVARAKAGDGVAATQAARLLERIGPANYAEITVEPRLGWLPVSVVEGWINNLTRSRGTIALERNGAFLTRVGVDYLDIANDDDELRIALGYLNHDMAFFRPRTSRDEDLEDKRTKLAAAYREHFVAWLEAEPTYQAQVVEAHNRLFRGWVSPTYDQGPIEIARWNPQYPLWPYQNSAVRRLVSNRGGGCFFDVGLGKTRTLLGAIALAKQQGLARRVLVAAPNSLVFNWAREIERVLPDYRYAIIGARAKVAQRGTKRGEVVSEPDTPAQRASKWQRFQAGLYDLVVVTYSALPRVQMSVDEVVKIVRAVPAVQRELVLKVREAERRIETLEKRAKKGKLTDDQEAELEGLRKQLKGLIGTERKEAILAEREEGYAAKYAVPPSGLEADPGVYWEQLGVDFLAYDESHIGKNLWTAGAREGGEPRFLGAPQEGSYIAWQLYLRAYLVRQSSGNAGVYLADATPAKNSPLEFLSALSMLDSEIWSRLGITDTEQYITQYLNIQPRLIQDSDLQPIEAPCVVGFKNLDFFAEDSKLLPEGLFSEIVKTSTEDAKQFACACENLFRVMSKGGMFGHHKVRHFNGHLFEEATVFELNETELGILVEAAAADWQFIQPSIMGTLFERALDENQRAQLGAHYTSEQDILTLVEPVLMSPLREEWSGIRGELAASLKRGKATQEQQKKVGAFLKKLSSLVVLDPACGSGNFLYVSLQLLLDLEKEVITLGTQLGMNLNPKVSVRQLRAIEVNPYAYELAQVSVQIGFLQWRRENGFDNDRTPILQVLDGFENKDALMNETFKKKSRRLRAAREEEHHGQESLFKIYIERTWPDCDVIIGNPPFVGGSRIWRQLGRGYQTELWRVYKDRVPGAADLCCYWFEKARQQIETKKCKRAGLLATQAIRGGANREVLKRIKETGDIFFAESDRDWILDGAAVHVSMIGFDDGSTKDRLLDGKPVEIIHANLTSLSDTTTSKTLTVNLKICFIGTKKAGKFEIAESQAITWLRSPNTHGKPNSDVLRPWVNGNSLVTVRQQKWIVDAGVSMPLAEMAGYEKPFSHVVKFVKPDRDKNNEPRTKENYWIHKRPGPDLRAALSHLTRCVAVVRHSKHLIFSWLNTAVLPDDGIQIFARTDDLFFGIVASRVHAAWAFAQGTQVREKESGFRYTPQTCFEMFPFPRATPRQEAAISAAAKDLDDLRERWLNPPEWSMIEMLEFPGSLGGPWQRYLDKKTIDQNTGIGTVRYPRLSPRDAGCAAKLKERTLT